MDQPGTPGQAAVATTAAAQFCRLRIAGFKSFAEPAVVDIRPGLTGIVGPNGCGKSNVVEALRWVMGESSAKSLRGGDMDDVIFAGTTHRASRNLAEVALTLEAPPRGALPVPFEAQAELEVARRIARGAGSVYRVNGKEARARDVQTLFADLGSGARASAMVSQGRVGALVAARPDERRSILEEAAGIGGLHSRRHEAELKLRAAESNLERAEALRVQLTGQLAALAKQARQARRYRDLSGLIRAAEAELLALQRARAAAARAAAAALRVAAETARTACENEAARLAAAARAAASALPALREGEAACRTALERRRIACEQIAAEQSAARAALAVAQAALGRISADRAHADQGGRDAAAAEQRLAGEESRLRGEEAADPAALAAAEAALAGCVDALRAADLRMHEATSAMAALSARGQALGEARVAAEARAGKLGTTLDALIESRAGLRPTDPAELAAAEAAVAAEEAAAHQAGAALEAAEAARAAAGGAHQATRAALHTAETLHARLAAEQQALLDVLAVHMPGEATPLLDQMSVPEGLEAAIGAVLDDALEMATAPDAPRFFRALPPLDPCPALPEGAIGLADRVSAPTALARALGQIGLVEDASGAAMQARLAAGQVLVSAAGAVWRWDGFVQRAGAPSAAAVRLRQRNRLVELGELVDDAARQLAAARDTEAVAQQAERDAVAAETRARAGRRDSEQALQRTGRALHLLQAQSERDGTRIAALDAQIARISGEREGAMAELAAARDAEAGLPDPRAARAAVETARAALAQARSGEHAARGVLEARRGAATVRAARLTAIGAERAGWAERARQAAGRAIDLDQRWAEAQASAAELAERPGRLIVARQEAAEAQALATARHRAEADRLAAAETDCATADRLDRAAVAAVAEAREAALRALAAGEAADHAWGSIAARIVERLGADAALPMACDLSAEAEERARRRHERLAHEREEMGPVNLRAELEAGEIEQRLAAIDQDRDELTTAIHKLRGSIGHLNHAGRERLVQVFGEVDRHFQALFARMFGGGRAQLALVGSDDPLQAGLEIYAQPPGKKLATLSLLSGGEQALTALSLIFAVFRCNPAPVCVLDEVDAPLDDANIERFCTLLADMVAQTGTRFLVVTHHYLTMARMDRLYGVTMQERGVSRLLSVDLACAAALADPVAIAAE